MITLTPSQMTKARSYNGKRPAACKGPYPADSAEWAAIVAAFQADEKLIIDGMFGPSTEVRWQQVHAPSLPIRVESNKDNLKPKARDFSKALYLQIHQTDFWAGDKEATIANIKTNLYVSTKAVYEVHPLECIVDHNYSDFVHIEVSWVSESRKTVTENGKTYHREAGEWTPAREALLETAIVYAVERARKQGVELTLITHCQTYSERTIDPDIEIAQATYRNAKKHGFKLDFDWVRGSGKSAAKWYPEGCGKLS
jgi:hypothetical protein